MRLRQVALVATDLEAAEEHLEKFLGLDPGYHDPGIIEFGLDNWVAAIGDTYLEVVSPVQENTTAGRYLERRGGDGGYMVILQVADLAAARERLEQHGARIVWNARGEDAMGSTTEGLHVHPRDCGGAILSVDESNPKEAWVWAGDGWQDRKSHYLDQLVGVELQSSDAEAMAGRWGELLGVSVAAGEAPDGRPAFVIDLDQTEDAAGARAVTNGRLRFVEDENGRGDGVSGFDVRVRDAEVLEARAAAVGAELERRDGVAWADTTGVRVFFHGA